MDGFSEVAPAWLVEGMAPDSVGTPFWPMAGIAVGVETMTWPLGAVSVTGDPILGSMLLTMAGIVTDVTSPLAAVLGMTVLAGGPTTPVTPVVVGCPKLMVEFAKTMGIPGRNRPLNVVFIGEPVPVGVTGTRGQVGHGLVMTTVVFLPVPVAMGHVGHGAVAVTVVLPTFVAGQVGQGRYMLTVTG